MRNFKNRAVAEESERKRTLSRPRRRWMHNIKTDHT